MLVCMIDEAMVRHLARLARVALIDEEVAVLRRDCAAVLDYVSELERVAVEEEKEVPLDPVRNVMREDAAACEADVVPEVLLEAVPVREGPYVRVKKILDA